MQNGKALMVSGGKQVLNLKFYHRLGVWTAYRLTRSGAEAQE